MSVEGAARQGNAVVIGVSGGIGAALVDELSRSGRYEAVIGLSRTTAPPIDIVDESSVREASRRIAPTGDLRLVIDATGFLHGDGMLPEKSWRSIDPVQMAHAFAVNAIGPALLMKHFLPLLPKSGRSVFATLSARVGSIEDNRLGGWYSYRASKAALNQLVRTAAIELSRTRGEAICVAIHPGTVDTGLSSPFAKGGLQVSAPAEAARCMVETLEALQVSDTGRFLDPRGARIAW